MKQILLCCLYWPLLGMAQNGWQHVSLPATANVLQIEKWDQQIFVLTTGGVYAADTASLHWTWLPATADWGATALHFAVGSEGLLAVTRQGTVEKLPFQADAPEIILQKPYPLNEPAERPLHVGVSGANIVVGSVRTLYRSTDGGQTWAFTHDDLIKTYNGIRKSEAGWFAGYDAYIYRSLDDGLHWERVFSSINFLRGLALNDSTISTVYRNSSRIAHSANGGNSWTFIQADDLSPVWWSPATWLDADGDYWCYASRATCGPWDNYSERLYYSTDQGFTRKEYSNYWDGSVPNTIRFLNHRLLVGSNNGLYRAILTDSLGTEPLQQGFDAAQVYALLVLPGGRVWSLSELGLLRSDDEGVSWAPADLPDLQPACDVLGVKYLYHTGNTTYVTMGNDIYRSVDGGNTWAPLFNDPRWHSNGASWDGIFYITGDSTLMLFHDDNPVPQTLPIPCLSCEVMANEGVLVLEQTSAPGKRFVSADYGQFFTPIPTEWNTQYVMHNARTLIVLKNNNTWLHYRFDSTAWAPHTLFNTQTGHAFSTDELASGVRFLGWYDQACWMGIGGQGLFFSRDSLLEYWTPYAPELPYGFPYAMALAGDRLWVGTRGNSIFHRQYLPDVPDSDPLFALWPNPSGPECTLKALYLQHKPLELQLYDLNGQLLRTQQLPPGDTWPLSLPDKPPGMYWWQIRVDDRHYPLKWIKTR